MMVCVIDTIFRSMIDAFKGVIIGLEIQEFDRMCPKRLVFPR